MEIRIIRDSRGKGWTAGRLYVDGEYFCDTLEDTVRTLRSAADKVPGQTAIPAGRYRARVTLSPRFRRDLILIERVPFFTGVRIHAGNTDADTEGCVLVGRRDSVAGRLAAGSRGIEAALTDTVRRAAGETHVTIVNAFGKEDGKPGTGGPEREAGEAGKSSGKQEENNKIDLQKHRGYKQM